MTVTRVLCDHLPESSVPRAGPQIGVAAKAGRTLTPLADSWVITVGIAHTLAAVWSSVQIATMFAGVSAVRSTVSAPTLLRRSRAKPRRGKDKSEAPAALRKSPRLMPNVAPLPSPFALHGELRYMPVRQASKAR